MPGIAEGIPGAKAFDEMYEQGQTVKTRNYNGGQPPTPKILVPPEPTSKFKQGVLDALGKGQFLSKIA